MPTLTPVDDQTGTFSLAQQRALAEADAARRAAADPNNPANQLRKPWEDYQQPQQRLPWQDFQSGGLDQKTQDAIAAARARVQSGNMSGMPAVDPNTGQPVGIPAFSPANFGQGGSALMGASNTASFGFGDELGSYLGSALSGLPRDQVLQEMRAMDSKAQAQNPWSYMGGQIGGGLAQGVATGGAGFGANAAARGASLGGIALGSALDGAMLTGAYGAGQANGDLADRLKGGAIGAGTGFVAGGVAPLVSTAITKGLSKIISPFASSPEREAAVQLLAQEGVPVTAGQRTGSKALQYAESELGGATAANAMEDQATAFTNAAMQRAGGSGRAFPDTLKALKSDLGQQFDDLSARNTLVADNQLVQDIGTTVNRYGRLLEPQQKPIIENLATDLVQRIRANGGTLPGTEYQAIRSDLSSAASSTTNETVAKAFRGLRNALDDAMGRSIPADEQQAWQTLRQQYGNYKVVARAAGGGGADSGLGLISPAQLRVAASTGNREGFATGASDFTDLAKAGQAVMTPLPNSGTASRLAVRNLGALAPTILGAGYGYGQGGDLQSALAGGAAGYALQKGAGAALMSGLGQAYLGNQVAAGMSNPASNALLAAILRQGATPAITNSQMAH